MTIEEKAKRYNEALERAKKAKNNASLSKGTLRVLDIIFPELKESEDECIEKIKKDIISYLNNRQITSIAESSATERWLSWLEKQCEQKPVEEYNDEDYGIDGLYHAQRILEKTLGEVEGYQSDDGILEHKCAISAVKNLYRQESNWSEEDEKIRNQIINFIEEYGSPIHCEWQKDWIAWLEKQGSPATLSEEEQNRFAKGVLSSCAMSFINYLDAHKYEGKMCVSNGECEDIENAFHNAMWDRLHRYYCKYIEKQDEKPQGKSAIKTIKEEKVDNANKVEPKFKVGELIKYNNLNVIYKVISVNNGSYCVENIETGGRLEYFNAEQNFHLWTIADAKDGDVLATKNAVFIFKNMDKAGLSLCSSYCEVIGNSELGFGFDFSINGILPATKEQRDTLERAIINAGYRWDAEKKELKKAIIGAKFKVGDWIVNNTSNLVYRVDSILFPQSKCYYLSHNGGIVIVSFNDEQNYHLWTIKDAKDGDVLVSQYNKPFIYNGNRDYFRIGSYCGISVDDKFKVATEKCNWAENVNIYPSTKEQRELLFTKMKESGYEWDDENKEPKKIETKGGEK